MRCKIIIGAALTACYLQPAPYKRRSNDSKTSVTGLFSYAVVVAVGSRTLQKAKDFVQETNSESAKPYGSYEEVLDDESVCGVYIPLPTSLHLEWVKKAADKRKHILLEKPIALVSDSSTTVSNQKQAPECACVHTEGSMTCLPAAMVRSTKSYSRMSNFYTCRLQR